MVEEKKETEKKNEEPEAPEEPEKPRKSRMDGIQRQAFLLTINNPQKYDMGHERIKQNLVMNFPTLKFFCMADEIGEQGTYHTHVYMILYMDKIEKIRQAFLNEKFKGKRRLDLHVTYIWGATGRGKTRSIMDAYGDSNVYRVIENGGGHPFDQYDGHAVIVFEEFRSSFKISDMLNYLDVYPVTLPARYCNKVVCYNRVFITTNIPLEEQYQEVQKESPETWAAFLRRIHEVQVYLEDGTIVKYDSVEKYLNRNKDFHKLEPIDECPFK